MEEEAREISKSALVSDEPAAQNQAQAIRRHIEPLGGVELPLPPRQPVRRAPTLAEYLLDTDVISEALRPALRPFPDEAVLGWLAKQDRDLVFTTAITQAEILYGLEMLPAGKRRNRLHAAVERLYAEEFRGRILPFDVESALVCPKIVADRDRQGRPISQFDAIIASVCRSRNAKLATRNISDFEQCGLDIIDPWNGH